MDAVSIEKEITNIEVEFLYIFIKNILKRNIKIWFNSNLYTKHIGWRI